MYVNFDIPEQLYNISECDTPHNKLTDITDSLLYAEIED